MARAPRSATTRRGRLRPRSQQGIWRLIWTRSTGSQYGEAVIRVVIADDHSVVRRGLRQLLDGESEFEVVAEASDLDGARRYVRGHRPDVLVLDLNMPGGNSLD